MSTEERPLDACSQVVSGVAGSLIPRVAALRVERRTRGARAQGAGSGVVFTEDGFVLTNAHVLDRSSGARPRSRTAGQRPSA